MDELERKQNRKEMLLIAAWIVFIMWVLIVWGINSHSFAADYVRQCYIDESKVSATEIENVQYFLSIPDLNKTAGLIPSASSLWSATYVGGANLHNGLLEDYGYVQVSLVTQAHTRIRFYRKPPSNIVSVVLAYPIDSTNDGVIGESPFSDKNFYNNLIQSFLYIFAGLAFAWAFIIAIHTVNS